jgi:polar amino acid transport system substrate-binding protein
LKNGRFIAFLAGISIGLTSFGASAQEVTFRVCVDEQNTPPLLTSVPSSTDRLNTQNTAIKGTHPASGLLIDLMGYAINDLNLNLEVIRYPWQRCIAKFKSGDMDAIVGLVWQKEYEKWAVFPMQAGHPDDNYRLWDANYSVYVAKDSQIQWDGVNFDGLDTGASAPQGLFIENSLKYLQAFSSKLYIPEDGLRLVSLNHLDAYVMETAQGRALIKQHALEGQLKELAIPFADTSWFVPVSSKWAARNPDLTHQFWQALKHARIEYGPLLLESYEPRYSSLSPLP